jgi:hypothetical protein
MLIHPGAILSPKRIQRVQSQILRVLFVLAHLFIFCHPEQAFLAQ